MSDPSGARKSGRCRGHVPSAPATRPTARPRNLRGPLRVSDQEPFDEMLELLAPLAGVAVEAHQKLLEARHSGLTGSRRPKERAYNYLIYAKSTTTL